MRGAACASVVVGVALLMTVGVVAASGQPAVAPGIGPAKPATGTAIIRGTVLAADTGAPVRRAQVRAMSSDGQDNRVTLSDDQGRFELKDLVGGRYTVMASRTGFVTMQYGQRRPNERGTPVEVAAGGVRDKVAFGLPRGGVITGRLTDEVGDPLADAQVQVLRSMFTNSGRRLMPAGRMDTTDDQGAFRLHGLAPGEYVIAANYRSVLTMMNPGSRPSGDADQGFAPTYYPGTPAMGDAQRVIVALGQEVSGISFAMTPTRVARVAGRVTGGTPGEYEGFVSLSPEDMATGPGIGGGAQLQADGAFEMNGVAPGRYVLRVQPRGNRRDDDPVGLVTLTVAGADLTGLVIPLLPPSRIVGRIEFEGGAPADAQPSQVRVMPLPLDPMGGRFMMSGPPRTNADWTFSVTGATQPVLLRTGMAGWYLKAVFVDGEDVTDTPITVAPGTTVAGVRLLLTRTATTLSGIVRDDRGNASSSAAIVIFPVDDERMGPLSRFLRSTRPDAEGRYEFKGLPPYGNYRVIAVESLEDGQIWDPDFIASLRDRAERLALTEGETKTHDLRVRP